MADHTIGSPTSKSGAPSFRSDLSDLPRGWFSPADIEWYREIYEGLPDCSWTAEVGCYRGRSICSVADIIKRKRLHVICVDKWEPFTEDSSTGVVDDFLANVTDRGLFPVEHLSVQMGPSVEVAAHVRDVDLAFVFIDADHSYESVKADIEAWEPKVRPGGWIGGHDYYQFPGVTRAVNQRYGNRVLTRMDSLIWLVRLPT